MKKLNVVRLLCVFSFLTSCGGSESSIPTSNNESIIPSVTSQESITSSTSQNSSQQESSSSINTCVITLDLNGGEYAISSITATKGEVIEKLENEPTRDGYKFIGWCYDDDGKEEVKWPITVENDITLHATWNKVVDISSYLLTLVSTIQQDPYSYIPNEMKPTHSLNHVNDSDVDYDFTSNTQVSSIKYGGYGEQWNMIIDNIIESQRFYTVIGLMESVINSSVVIFNNYFDDNPSDVASHKINEATYSAQVNYENNELDYSLILKSGITIPLFGEIIPQIDMYYNIATYEKSVRVQIGENNSLKYIVNDNSYEFALQYGIEEVSRKAYFSIEKGNDDSISGKIYEFIQLKDKDLVPACAEFYINDEYASAIGNKASGMTGFNGYIDELYQVSSGKLLAYEVRETLSFVGVQGTYNTLWFNLDDVSGINSVKAIANDNFGIYGKNNHDIYLNGSASIFDPVKNSKLGISTSRKYDVELRKQYFYGYDADGQLVKYETLIPMLFVQADNDKDSNFTDFPADILSKNGISASITLNRDHLNKLESDYAKYVDIFIENKSKITGEYITQFIGNSKEIEIN